MRVMQKWLLKSLFKDLVIQGPHLDSNVEQVFCLLRDAWYREFTEDNLRTQRGHLKEIFDRSENHS